LIMCIGHGADPGFLAVSLHVTLVINPVVGCLYFPSDQCGFRKGCTRDAIAD